MRREDSSRRGQASAGPCRRPSCRLWVQGAAGGPGGLCVHPLRARFRKRPRPPPLPPASPFALRLRHASRHQLGSVLTPASPERGPACDLLWTGLRLALGNSTWQKRCRPRSYLGHARPRTPPLHLLAPPPPCCANKPGPVGWRIRDTGLSHPSPSHVCGVVLD